jgi:hypothetical protein
MAQAFSTLFVIMGFNLNRAYIAKNLCENRFRPKMNCNGKCVLMKKLKQQEQEEQNKPVAKSEIITVVLSSKSFFATALPSVAILSASYNSPEDSGKPIGRNNDIFHPPLV